MKALISIILSLALLAGGYFGMRFAMDYFDFSFSGNSSSSFAENSRPRDNTGFVPEFFTWGAPNFANNESRHFLAGKYVRDDGNAVLYISYEDARDYFAFELFAVKDDDSDEFGLDSFADLDGRTAVCETEGITFESIKAGVIDAGDYGMFYIVRAKYTETPKPDIDNDTGD